MTDATRELAAFAAGLTYEALPAEVRARVKQLVMDTVGIAVRARHDAESTQSLLAAAAAMGLAGGAARVLGDESRYAPPAAAMINGTLAHSLDFDDTHAAGSIHSSAPIVPAALAAAEMVGASGKQVIAAIAAGYEVQIRLSLALVPKDHYDRGYHPSATCGAFGAAAAAGSVFGLSADQIAHALGIALSQAAGSMQFLADGAWTKRYQVGQAGANGLIAASLAREGFTGPKQAIEGQAGFLNSYAPSPVPERAVAGLGEVWETMALAVKPYPSCRYSHAAMDALIALRREHGLAAEEIEGVEIGLPRTGFNIIGAGEQEKQNPANAVEGQFSMPFCAAVVLRQGSMGWDDYELHLGDPETRALARKVRCVIDPVPEEEFPRNMAGIARVDTARGRFERYVRVPKGEPDNFLTGEELRGKFDGLTAPYLSAGRRDGLADALLALEEANDIGALLDRARPDLAEAAGQGSAG